MKRYVLKILLTSFLVMIVGGPLFAQEFDKKATWVENFNKRGRIDSRYWNYHVGKFDTEEEYYRDSIGNVYVKNGKLHIVATKNPYRGKICSSGRIHTLKKQSFLYGKLELKAKLPTGKGIFPAIWMLREDHAQTYPLGEIDIVEYIECFDKKQYCATVHIVEEKTDKSKERHTHTSMVDADMKKFHIYTLEWTPESLVYKLDRKVVFTLRKTEAEFWPFDDPYYLILNVAYGSWGAQCGMDDNIFPCEMVVDWIKYYKMKN